VLERYVRLLHPVMPFITEAIWTWLPHEPADPDLLIVAAWPDQEREAALGDPAAEAAVEALIDLIRAVRNARAEAGIPAAVLLEADLVLPDPDVRAAYTALAVPFGRLARLRPVRAHADSGTLSVSAQGGLTIIATAGEARLSRGAGDLEGERSRLERQLADAERMLVAAKSRLADSAFTTRAPEGVVEGARRRRDALIEQVATLAARLEDLRKSRPVT
jgi:valyl-tRNA synthetase